MKREHVAVLALLVVVLVAVALIVWSGQRPDAETVSTGEAEPPVAGRQLRTDELETSCALSGPPVVIEQPAGVLGACTLTVTSTQEPFWSIPLLEQFLQPELRTLRVTLADCDAAAVEIGSTSESLGPEEELSIAIQADGATVTFRSLPGCRLLTDVEVA